MRLIIAEKPSLGRAIAAVLPKPHTKGDGFIKAANGDVVSWCIGHLLEQAEPDAYDPAFKKWQLAHLPIIPEQWQLQPKPKTRKQLTVLRKLIKEADQLVHAGDPDREGQLLVDEVVDYLKASQAKRRSMQRLLISDLNPAAVARALANMRPNSEFVPLSVSALARSRADWLYGINQTRAWTIKGQQLGGRGVLSVGRVQTPVLGLVVRRDQEISAFVSKPFYEVRAALHINQEGPVEFIAKWQPSEACAAHQDDDGRVLNPKLADAVAKRIRQQPALVTSVERKEKNQRAPLPYNLSSLQIDASKAFGFSAQQVLDTCQSLYEKHQLITYPRSDCRYLPNEHFAEAAGIFSAIAANETTLKHGVDHADVKIKSSAFNSKKVDAHHAVIPTQKKYPGTLSNHEQKVYLLISRQYLMQFYPAFNYADTQVDVDISGGQFRAREREVLHLGWKALLPTPKDAKLMQLPSLEQGQALWSGEPIVDSKQTEAPTHYTDATLLSAMTGIARHVQNTELKKVLRETDGLGTEATRAGIIELLFKRKFLQRQGKTIRSTPVGQSLISILPQECSLPDMTAEWEHSLTKISERSMNYEVFMSGMHQRLEALILQASTYNVSAEIGNLIRANPAASVNRKKTQMKVTRANYRKRSSVKP